MTEVRCRGHFRCCPIPSSLTPWFSFPAAPFPSSSLGRVKDNPLGEAEPASRRRRRVRRRFSTGRSFVVEGNLFVVNAAALLIKADILLGTVTEDIEAFRHLFPKKTTEWFSSPNNHANQHAPWICIGYHGIEFLTEPKLAQTNDINVVSPF